MTDFNLDVNFFGLISQKLPPRFIWMLLLPSQNSSSSPHDTFLLSSSEKSDLKEVSSINSFYTKHYKWKCKKSNLRNESNPHTEVPFYHFPQPPSPPFSPLTKYPTKALDHLCLAPTKKKQQHQIHRLAIPTFQHPQQATTSRNPSTNNKMPKFHYNTY